MITDLLAVDQNHPDRSSIERAALLIRSGRLVAFPTETVYGLGANALDPAAVQSLFAAKGRPSSNPVIVHVADAVQVVNVASEWPETARQLARHFWPGPLTIVVGKQPAIPAAATAGGPTVAVRCPDHPVARALINASGVPIAAPSANRSTELSPTRAEHVWKSLNGRIDMILDGGPCPGGIESTVVDVTGDDVQILRPGLVSRAMLEMVVGKVHDKAEAGSGNNERLRPADHAVISVARSPGQLARHYSPKTELRLVDSPRLVDDLLEASHVGKRVGAIVFNGEVPALEAAKKSVIDLTGDPIAAAARLYATLFDLDQWQLDFILVEEPPLSSEWDAIRDRLRRAATRSG